MRSLGRYAVYLLALLALGISFARFALPPLIESYKDEILAQLSQLTGKHFAADAVSVYWRGDGHGFRLKNLRLLNAAGATVLSAESLYLKFSLIEVMRHGNIAPSKIRVVGTHIAAIRHEDGQVSLHGIEHSGDVDLSALFLQPLFLEIVDSQVTVIDRVHEDSVPLHFSPVTLLIRNEGKLHRLSANVTADSDGPGSFVLISEFQTASDSLAQWRGRVYLKTQQLDLAWLLQNRFPGHYELEKATSSMEIWSHWDKGRLVTLEGHMYSENLHFRSVRVEEAPELALDYFGGRFRWTREQSGWLLDIANPMIRHGDAVWPTKALSVAIRQVSGKGPLHFYLGADIFSIDGLFKALAVHPPDHPMMKDLFAAQAKGDVINPYLHLRMQRPIEWEFSATLERLETSATGMLPEIKGIRMVVAAAHDSGSVKVAGGKASIYAKSLFRQPIVLQQLAGELRWQKQPNGDWLIATDDLIATSEDISTMTSFRYMLPLQGKAYLDMVTDFKKGRVEHASRYYPAFRMKPVVVKWLDRSLVGGYIPSGRFRIQGPLASFPFEDNADGFFEALFNVTNAEIDYKEGWPPLRNTDALVRFHGNRLTIEAAKGEIYDNQIGHVTMEMQLNPPTPLHIRGDITGSLDGPVRLLTESPLKEKFAPLMEALEFRGDGNLSIDMQVPISRKLKHSGSFSGDLELRNAEVSATRVALALQDVNGVLHITDSGASANQLQATLLGSPLTMAITPMPDGATQISAAIDLADASLQQVIADAPVSGRALWNVNLEVPSLAEMRRGGLVVNSSSDLKGMEVDLPLSLGKTRQQSRRLELQWRLSNSGTPSFKLDYGDMKLNMQHRQGGWSGEINARALAGKLTIPDARKQLVRVDLERLNLAFSLDSQAARSDSSGKHRSPHHLRPFHLTSKKLALNGRPFGKLSVKTRHIPGGHEMTRLKVESPNDNLVASGSWMRHGQGATTTLKLSLVAAEIGETLKSLDLSQQLDKAQGSIDADLSWDGSPADFATSRLNGTLLLDTKQGRFSEAQPGLARILGFLNVGALKRRLQLDFSDLTEKGFSFDEMRGRFALRKGSVSTDGDLVIKAPAADIRVSGDLDLVTRQVEQKIRVIPDIHGMLPLAGIAAGGPAVGAALLVAGTVAGEQIDRIAEIEYRATGPWENPEIVRVSRGGKRKTEQQKKDQLVQPFVDSPGAARTGSGAAGKASGTAPAVGSRRNSNPIGGDDYDDPLADFQ